MKQSSDLKVELSKFLVQNLDFYTKEWLQYLQKNKGYLMPLLKDSGYLSNWEQFGNPVMNLVADNIIEINTLNIMNKAQETGIHAAKIEFPIHCTWELIQSTRGIIWNAIKAFYFESEYTLESEEFFTLERYVNDIIDLFIDSFTHNYLNYKEEILNSHRETVDELTVPIIPIAEKVCILPVVGNVDTYRAKKISEKTLLRVKELKAQKLIIDISGVPFVDTAVVSHLFKVVKAIKLLGCSSILTGISPEVADTMIELGIEIDKDLKTRSDLQQALQEIHWSSIAK